MGKLLLKLSYLIVILGLIPVGINHYLRKNSYYKFDESVNTLFLGDSHVECAINDSLIENSINLASSADAYFYTYYKLRKLVEANPAIHTVLLGYIDDFFLKAGDEYTFGEEYMGNKYPKYCQLIPLKDKLFLFFKRPGVFLIATRDAIKQNYILLFKKPERLYLSLNWGGYLYLTRDKLPKNIETFSGSGIVGKRPGLPSISKLNIRYLKMIADYCSSKKINLILFRPPLHKFCVRNDEEFTFLVKNDLKNAGYLDYSDFPMEDSDFGDLSHLNYKGARKFSGIINVKLNNNSTVSDFPGANIKK
jgi:hypothetical protein